jgi:hypothetical protein
VTVTTGLIPETLVLEGPNPTATQARGVGHETAESPVTGVGTVLEIQDCPPLLVPRMAWELPPRGPMPPPTTTQLTAVGHEIALRKVVRAGGRTSVHDAPASRLTMVTPDGDPSGGEASPTSRQRAGVGQAIAR